MQGAVVLADNLNTFQVYQTSLFYSPYPFHPQSLNTAFQNAQQATPETYTLPFKMHNMFFIRGRADLAPHVVDQGPACPALRLAMRGQLGGCEDV